MKYAIRIDVPPDVSPGRREIRVIHDSCGSIVVQFGICVGRSSVASRRRLLAVEVFRSSFAWDDDEPFRFKSGDFSDSNFCWSQVDEVGDMYAMDGRRRRGTDLGRVRCIRSMST